MIKVILQIIGILFIILGFMSDMIWLDVLGGFLLLVGVGMS
jgi:hypothetical protein